MTRILFVICATSLLTIGCTAQRDDLADKTATTDESPEAWPTEPDEPTVSVPSDTGMLNGLDPRAEQLKSVSQAFHAYQKHFGYFPPAASTDESGDRL